MATRQNKNQHDDRPAVTLGETIRKARELGDMSARRLSADVHMHPSYIARLEAGTLKHPSPENLYRIATHLDLNYADLCALAGYEVPGLPALPAYLRVKYDMTDEDVRRLTEYFELLKAQHGIVEKKHSHAEQQDFELTEEMKHIQDEGGIFQA